MNQILKLDINKLPIKLEVFINGEIKEYLIKTNREKTGVFLNKLEKY